jgi:hypothetical protein
MSTLASPRARKYAIAVLVGTIVGAVVVVFVGIVMSDQYPGADVTFRDGSTEHCEDFWISGWGEKNLSCTYDDGGREIFPMDTIESVVVLEDV